MDGSAGMKEATPQAVSIDTIMPAEMAVRAEQGGVRRASMDPLTVLVLSVMGGAFISFGAIFATTVSAGSQRAALRRGEAVVRDRLLGGVRHGRRRRRRAVHGKQPDRHGLGERQGEDAQPAAELARHLRRKLRRSDRDGRPDVLHHAVHLRRRRGGSGGVDDGQQQGGARLRARIGARHHVQRAGVSGVLDVLQRAHDRRPGRHHHSPDRRVRRRRLRAQHRERLFHSDGALHQGRSARHVLEFDRQDRRGFSGPELDRLLREPGAGGDRQHHWRIAAGRGGLLVRLPAQARPRRHAWRRGREGTRLHRNSDGTMLTNRIFAIVVPG